MDDWIDYYDSAHTIYVSARHRDVHFRRIADDIAGYAGAADIVLDYGCGEAVHADRLAAKVARLILVEPAPGVRARLTQRFSANGKIAVGGPDALAAIADRSIDLAVMHSVAQYLTPDELDAALAIVRRLLKPSGRVLLGDVLQPGVSALTDAAALLGFGAAHGFFFAALFGLARTVLSRYWRLRSRLGLTRYSEQAMLEKLAAAGFSARRAPDNIGHNQARMTFVAHPAAA